MKRFCSSIKVFKFKKPESCRCSLSYAMIIKFEGGTIKRVKIRLIFFHIDTVTEFLSKAHKT